MEDSDRTQFLRAWMSRCVRIEFLNQRINMPTTFGKLRDLRTRKFRCEFFGPFRRSSTLHVAKHPCFRPATCIFTGEKERHSVSAEVIGCAAFAFA